MPGRARCVVHDRGNSVGSSDTVDTIRKCQSCLLFSRVRRRPARSWRPDRIAIVSSCGMEMLIWAALQSICGRVLVLAVFFVLDSLFVSRDLVIGSCLTVLLRVGVGLAGHLNSPCPNSV